MYMYVCMYDRYMSDHKMPQRFSDTISHHIVNFIYNIFYILTYKHTHTHTHTQRERDVYTYMN